MEPWAWLVILVLGLVSVLFLYPPGLRLGEALMWGKDHARRRHSVDGGGGGRQNGMQLGCHAHELINVNGQTRDRSTQQLHIQLLQEERTYMVTQTGLKKTPQNAQKKCLTK